jgi:hypothetical protein
LKKLNFRIEAKGKSRKKARSKRIRIVTAGTMNLSTSILVAEISYSCLMAASLGVFIDT